MNLSELSNRLDGQAMFQILSRAQELERLGKDLIHFEIGDPDFGTPLNIKNAACEAIMDGDTHYTNSMGLLELREAAIDVTEKSRGFRPSLDQVLVTPGANAQLFYAIACTMNPGDEVIIPDPSFVSYASIIKMLGGIPVRVPLKESNDFRLDPDDVQKAITSKTAMIIMNSPSNPTGAVMQPDEIMRVAFLSFKHGIYLLSDEIYARMIYTDGETTFSSPSIYDKCEQFVIIVNGFSKSYAMTGWRLGVVTGPSQLIAKMGLMLETTTSCVSPFIQRAGIVALRDEQNAVNSMLNIYRDRRDLIVEALNNIKGISCREPKGGFYVFPNITKTGKTSNQVFEALLEAGVVVAPGTIFGEHGEGYIRLCYANGAENIARAMIRIKDAL